jgi:hypothetical protein
MYIRDTTGHQIPAPGNNPALGWTTGNPITIPVPVRASNPRVLHIAALRDRLQAETSTPFPTQTMPQQNGSAEFALEVLQPPWRQRFEGTVDHAGQGGGDGRFVGGILVAQNVANLETQTVYKEILNFQSVPK